VADWKKVAECASLFANITEQARWDILEETVRASLEASTATEDWLKEVEAAIDALGDGKSIVDAVVAFGGRNRR
jgi:hypothetical protein